MDAPTHIIDPVGEVIIVLSNANAPLPEVDDQAYRPAALLDTMPSSPETHRATDDSRSTSELSRNTIRRLEPSRYYTENQPTTGTSLFGASVFGPQNGNTPAPAIGNLSDTNEDWENDQDISVLPSNLQSTLLGDITHRAPSPLKHDGQWSSLFTSVGSAPQGEPSAEELTRAAAAQLLSFDILANPSTASEGRIAEATERGSFTGPIPADEDAVVRSEDNAEHTEMTDGTATSTDEVFRIQVSAKHLSLASPVLKALLTGGWKENVTLLQKGSVEITAESWDLDALLIMLRIIHGQHSLVPRDIDLKMFAKIALIVDYYECSEAMGIAADLWISKLQPCPNVMCRDLVFWMWISWAFRLPEIFQQATSTAMSTSDHAIPHIGFPIPDGVIALMNTRREIALGKLFSLIHETQEALLSGRVGCGFACSSIMYGALAKQIQNTVLALEPGAPFNGITYDQVRLLVSSIVSPMWWSEAPAPGLRFRHHSSRASVSATHHCGDSSFNVLLQEKLQERVEGLDVISLCEKK